MTEVRAVAEWCCQVHNCAWQHHAPKSTQITVSHLHLVVRSLPDLPRWISRGWIILFQRNNVNCARFPVDDEVFLRRPVLLHSRECQAHGSCRPRLPRPPTFHNDTPDVPHFVITRRRRHRRSRRQRWQRQGIQNRRTASRVLSGGAPRLRRSRRRNFRGQPF